jgi:single-strand DNA-binding protein
MNLNKVFIIGRVTKDPEMRTTTTGQNVSSFGVATNKTWVDKSGQKQETVEFHDIVVWGRLAEIATQYLKKGQLLMVEGRLQTRNWVGQDGIKRYKTEIVAENFQMGPKASGFSNSQQTPPAQNYAPKPATTPTENQPTQQIEDIPIIQVEEEPIQTEPVENILGDEEVVPF